MEIGKEIKRVRKEAGYTQLQFAKKLGVTREHYNGVESGRHGITLGLLKKIDKVTGKQLVITFIDRL